MSPKSKALPTDIDNFFKGTSAFFPPAPGRTQKDDPLPTPNTPTPQKAKTERSNGLPERSNGRTHDPAPVSTTDRSGERVSRAHAPVSLNVPAPSILRSTPPREAVVVSSVATNDLTQASILAKLQQGKLDRPEKTERYSFEIYPEQKEMIEDFLYQYKKKTGEKLSASKLIREALTIYFDLLKRNGTN